MPEASSLDLREHVLAAARAEDLSHGALAAVLVAHVAEQNARTLAALHAITAGDAQSFVRHCGYAR